MTETPLKTSPDNPASLQDRPAPPDAHHLTRAMAAAQSPAPNPAAPQASAPDQAPTVAPEAEGPSPEPPAAPDTPPSPARVYARPIHPPRAAGAKRPLAWSGFLLGTLALLGAVGLAALLWRFAGEETGAPPPVVELPAIPSTAIPSIAAPSPAEPPAEPSAEPSAEPAPEPSAAPPAPGGLTLGELLELETLLDQLGFPPGPLDGTIDAEAVAAIRDFQATAGLPVDGTASAALLEELRAALAELTGQ